MRNLFAATALILMVSVTSGGVSFRGKPTVRAEAGGVRIDFALTAPGDVEVAVVNEKGEVVRHLAAGAVGAEAAAPPLKAAGGLYQSKGRLPICPDPVWGVYSR